MTFNIWLPILVNLLIVGIVVAGVFAGRKIGIKLAGIKLLVICALGVGIYFLAPVITDALISIEAINALITSGALTYGIINSLVILVLFLIVYGITTAVFRIFVTNRIDNTANIRNTAKMGRPQGMNRKETIKLRKRQRVLAKANWKSLSKETTGNLSTASKVFGGIFGGILGLVFAFVLTLPMKPGFDKAAENPDMVAIQTGYEYTPFGQLDNWTGIVDKIIHN